MGLYYIASEENMQYLAHHGVRGQKWGRRKNREHYGLKTNVKRFGLLTAKGVNAAGSGIAKGASKLLSKGAGETELVKTLNKTSNKLADNKTRTDNFRKALEQRTLNEKEKKKR